MKRYRFTHRQQGRIDWLNKARAALARAKGGEA